MDRKNSENGVRIHAKRKRRKATRTKEQMIQERKDKTEKAIELFNTGMTVFGGLCLVSTIIMIVVIVRDSKWKK